MSSTLTTTRRTRRVYQAIGALVSAAIIATSVAGCKTLDGMSKKDQDKVIAAAAVGIIAALAGRAMTQQKSGEAGAGAGSVGNSAAAGRAISGEITSAKALRMLYGNLQTVPQGQRLPFDEEGKVREWAQWVTPKDDFFEEISRKAVAVHKLSEKRYTEKGVEKYILITQAPLLNASDNDDWCPTMVFGTAVFYKNDGQWKLGVEDKMMCGQHWVPGMLCSCNSLDYEGFTRIGPEKYGILNDFVYSHTGGRQDILGVTVFNNNSIDQVGLCEGESEVMSDPPVGTWDCEVKFDQTSTGEYYDAIVSYKSRASKRAKTVTITKRLRFVNGEYKEIKTAKKGSAKKRK